MNARGIIALVLLVVVGILVRESLFIVDERETAIRLRFGEVRDANIEPGLHFKTPFVESVRKLDARVLTLDSPTESFLTEGKKSLNVDAFVKWRIVDALAYYRSTSGDEYNASVTISSRMNDGLRNKFGERTLNEVVSGQRDELMAELTDELNTLMRNDLGIEVLDVRIKAIELPNEVSSTVYSRMSSERAKQAATYRSEGQEIAEGTRAEADREVIRIEAEAYRTAQALRGEGDAEAASIYAEAFTTNPEFYSFWRSLEAYKQSFGGGSDLMVLEPDRKSVV